MDINFDSGPSAPAGMHVHDFIEQTPAHGHTLANYLQNGYNDFVPAASAAANVEALWCTCCEVSLGRATHEIYMTIFRFARTASLSAKQWMIAADLSTWTT